MRGGFGTYSLDRGGKAHQGSKNGVGDLHFQVVQTQGEEGCLATLLMRERRFVSS